MPLDLPAADLDEFVHDFALATIDAVQKYDQLMRSLEAGSPPEDSGEEEAQIRLAASQGAVALSMLSVTLTELDLGRMESLDPRDDVRLVQPLLQAIAESLVVLASEPRRETLSSNVLLTQQTIERMLDDRPVRLCLESHFHRETGRELGGFPGWQADLLASAPGSSEA